MSHAEDTFSLNWEYADDLRNLVGFNFIEFACAEQLASHCVSS